MKKFLLIVLALIFLSSLVILIISLTDIVKVSVLHNYRTVVGLSFFVVNSFVIKAIKALIN